MEFILGTLTGIVLTIVTLVISVFAGRWSIQEMDDMERPIKGKTQFMEPFTKKEIWDNTDKKDLING